MLRLGSKNRQRATLFKSYSFNIRKAFSTWLTMKLFTNLFWKLKYFLKKLDYILSCLLFLILVWINNFCGLHTPKKSRNYSFSCLSFDKRWFKQELLMHFTSNICKAWSQNETIISFIYELIGNLGLTNDFKWTFIMLILQVGRGLPDSFATPFPEIFFFLKPGFRDSL